MLGNTHYLDLFQIKIVKKRKNTLMFRENTQK